MTYSTTRRNPYIIGRPINEKELIFGRESLFHFIEDNLIQNIKVTLLHGQRRMGKSSVLLNIPKFVAPDQFAFVPFDLQKHTQKPFYVIVYALVTEIINYLKIDLEAIALPSTTDLEKDPYIFSRQFLPQVYRVLNGKKLVLLLDEFDDQSNEVSNSVVKNFFSFLHLIAKTDDNLFIIPFAGRKSDDLPNLLNVFKEAPFQEIGLLDELSAKRLITKPSQGILEYDSDSVRAILELSAGHPYFTQIICFALFGRARELQNWKVSREDVESIVDKAIELAEAGLVWFWEGLSIPERVIFSAVAEAQKIAFKTDQPFSEEPLTLLKSFGVIQTEPLIQAAKQLTQKGFLDDTGQKVKVELIRRWLVQRHPLRQEIRQLEEIELEEVNPLWEIANNLIKQGKKQNALTICKQILEINPNHFSTVIALAEEYLEVEDFEQAVKLYSRAYQFDPIRHQEGLLRALQASGQNLLSQQEFIRAKEQFYRILEIEPDNRVARGKLLEIEVEIEPKFEATEHSTFVYGSNYSSNHNQSKSNRTPILLAAIVVTAGTVIIALIGVGIQRFYTNCSNSQQEVCIDSSLYISRGQNTLFLSIKNPNRDLGIEAFKQNKYSLAADFFQKSVATNRTDPEVLIYYNNALAQQKGSPLTLAVVVSVNNV
ncbi:ATP-binding protein [Iningainema tapete]|uniref:Orc1-like AAA ATPase domain-containing protein n=1 Tax=Iningainema tapete BLCC-T55 TaxID=2748662 RepID=A0A8J7C0R8_9CYAN|nr:ATP-binding protein [Iningainema tapete]MBD2778563.1 hypothetical protein [Iningainema tapete BLCC-T55]